MTPPLPFRAEHIGSLKRPARLVEARYQFQHGNLSRSELTAIEDEEILRIVKLQQKLGFKAITDGEFRRFMYFDGFFENLEGFTLLSQSSPEMYRPYAPDAQICKAFGVGPPTFLCTSKIRRIKPCYVPWFQFLAKSVSPEDVKHLKISIVSPEFLHLRHAPGYVYTSEAYSSDNEYFADIAQAYRVELDCGVDSDALLDRYVQLYNDCISSRKLDMTIGMHMCRGNFRGGIHFAEGGYDKIAVKLFNSLNVDFFYLEYDSPRAGGFEPLRYYPKTKPVVLGLISTKTPELEDKNAIVARLDEASRYLEDPKKDRMHLSPQCGFASVLEGNNISDQDMEAKRMLSEAKLALVVELAQDVWGNSSCRGKIKRNHSSPNDNTTQQHVTRLFRSASRCHCLATAPISFTLEKNTTMTTDQSASMAQLSDNHRPSIRVALLRDKQTTYVIPLESCLTWTDAISCFQAIFPELKAPIIYDGENGDVIHSSDWTSIAPWVSLLRVVAVPARKCGVDPVGTRLSKKGVYLSLDLTAEEADLEDGDILRWSWLIKA
ncbi:UROD/MetE-like protein [Calocera cornea HHB12733]|uniref:UROD/MetE-like protein n=1 Tax=Calocera cornea HHB12733 TaxID=1353952 RepID=A0A165E104_9BASI|nr:UROD/MetE-like protein [Calocera cornea HHB12733]